MAGYGDDKGVGRVLITFVLIVSVWFLFMGILEIQGPAEVTSSSPSNHKLTTLLPRKRESVPVKLDPIYANKRRVPSGPDPIHNRYFFPLFFQVLLVFM